MWKTTCKEGREEPGIDQGAQHYGRAQEYNTGPLRHSSKARSTGAHHQGIADSSNCCTVLGPEGLERGGGSLSWLSL